MPRGANKTRWDVYGRAVDRDGDGTTCGGPGSGVRRQTTSTKGTDEPFGDGPLLAVQELSEGGMEGDAAVGIGGQE